MFEQRIYRGNNFYLIYAQLFRVVDNSRKKFDNVPVGSSRAKLLSEAAYVDNLPQAIELFNYLKNKLIEEQLLEYFHKKNALVNGTKLAADMEDKFWSTLPENHPARMEINI